MEQMAKKGILTYTELAEALGISRTQLSNILSEKFEPVKSNVVELAEFLEVSPIELSRKKPRMNKMNKFVFRPRIDNIFDFSFMDDFTTVELAKEEYGIDISELKHEDEDDFYCFSEKKSYTTEELFKKFNIEVLE